MNKLTTDILIREYLESALEQPDYDRLAACVKDLEVKLGIK